MGFWDDWFSSDTASTGVASAPATDNSPIQYFNTLDASIGPNNGQSPSINLGNNGVEGGQQVIPSSNNSLLDSISKITTLGVNTIGTAFKTYGSFLESSAVADAAKRLNTTPQAVVGALPTVPLNNGQATSGTQQAILYLGFGAIAAVVLFSVLKKG